VQYGDDRDQVPFGEGCNISEFRDVLHERLGITAAPYKIRVCEKINGEVIAPNVMVATLLGSNSFETPLFVDAE